jgi:hypothetical protein
VSGGESAGGALDPLAQRGVVNLMIAQALKLTANRRSGAHAQEAGTVALIHWIVTW